MSNESLESIIVSRENWEPCAIALGDDNPIHYSGYENYGLHKPICPGIYLFSLAEYHARKDNYFKIPMFVKAEFNSHVYEYQNLEILKKYNDNELLISFMRADNGLESLVAQFIFRKVSGEYTKFEKSGIFESFYENISSSNLSLFNRSLHIEDNEEIFSTFVIGKILKYFLNGGGNKLEELRKERYGALLRSVEFDFFREVEIGQMNVEICVNDERKIKRNCINHNYIVYGIVNQNNELVGNGIGLGFYKERELKNK